MRFFANANYDFLGARRRALVILVAVMVPGVLMILARGVDYSVEFTGGTRIQIETQQPVDVGVLRTALEAEGIEGAEIQRFGSDREFVIRARTAQRGSDPDNTQTTRAAVTAAVDRARGVGTYEVHRTEAVSAKVGAELRVQAAWLVLLSFVAVLIYLAFRFEWRFGLAAVVAAIHDVVSSIAFIGLTRIEISLFVVGALLSIVGYSLNDTIVVLDRVRENLRKTRREDFTALLNRSINEMLPRTFFTGLTSVGGLLALAILGGEVVRAFAMVMLYGVVIGTISSWFVVLPALAWIEERWPGEAVKALRAPVKASPAAGSAGKKAQPAG